MICQCGAHIPDNVEYCPYCGKKQYLRSRPAKLTNNSVEPFTGDFPEGESRGCGGSCATVFCVIVLVIFLVGVALIMLGQVDAFKDLLILPPLTDPFAEPFAALPAGAPAP